MQGAGTERPTRSGDGSHDLGRIIMRYRSSIAALAAAAALATTFAIAQQPTNDPSKYPDWSGQWRRAEGGPNRFDPSKGPGRQQEAPLTPEYQRVYEAGLADLAQGGQGN